MKKLISLLCILSLVLTLAACAREAGCCDCCSCEEACPNYSVCGNPVTTAATTEPTTIPEETVDVHAVETIDLAGKFGSVKFEGTQTASAKLLSANKEGYTDDDAVIYCFTFTLAQATPAEFKDIFEITFFQNGVEVPISLWISGEDPAQYALCSHRFSKLLEGAFVTFGVPMLRGDGSPMTVMISEVADPTNYQMMEVTP